jgi:hypothetical protein
MLTIRLLNSAPYRDPAARHTYSITDPSGRPFVHVGRCPALRFTPSADTVVFQADAVGFAARVETHGITPCGCLPHTRDHVLLPNGARRHRPIQADTLTCAVATNNGRVWRLERWFASTEIAALHIAKVKNRPSGYRTPVLCQMIQPALIAA